MKVARVCRRCRYNEQSFIGEGRFCELKHVGLTADDCLRTGLRCFKGPFALSKKTNPVGR